MKAVLNLEIITPLFLGGAEQQPELRPSSVRGALRYWLRALLGGSLDSNDPSNINKLRDEESKVFGDTEKVSAVIVQISSSATIMNNFALDKDNSGKQVRSGYNYLYYATKLGNNNRIPYSPNSNQTLTLTLTSRPGIVNANFLLKQAGAAAWLLTHLGGLGMRSRRCAGSLQGSMESSNFLDLPEFNITSENASDFCQLLVGGLRQICSIVERSTIPPYSYDVLHPDLCRVWVIAPNPPYTTWKELVEKIGREMQDFRAKQGVDRNSINAIFGIPILHGPNHNLQRRASPLWLKVTRLANNNYVGVATLFQSDFMHGCHEVGGGYRLIEDFIINRLGGQEVIYR